MVGGILVVVALVVVLPVTIIISGGVLAGVISHLLRVDVEKSNEGSELLDLNG